MGRVIYQIFLIVNYFQTSKFAKNYVFAPKFYNKWLKIPFINRTNRSFTALIKEWCQKNQPH